ncbi:MAG: GTP-binding protein [Chloroflexi bacterium]|nr:GTP-binding protein [Chloroflexota bacterium]
MRLIAITGMLHQPKAKLTRALIELLSTKTDRLALMDNSDVPLAIDGVTSQRLTGGCVCCSLATALISLLGRLDADYALLPVSALADPGALASILASLRSERIQITTVSLIDTLTQTRNPYLTRKLESYSDFQVQEPFEMSDTIHAAIGAPK